MNIPITVKIPRYRLLEISHWVRERNIHERMTYDWATGMAEFLDPDDATAFCLVFNAHQEESKIEQMLKGC